MLQVRGFFVLDRGTFRPRFAKACRVTSGMLFAAALLWLALSDLAWAQSYNWRGNIVPPSPPTNLWSDPNDWDTHSVPNSASAHVNFSGLYNPYINLDMPATVSNLAFDAYFGGGGWTLGGANTLSIANSGLDYHISYGAAYPFTGTTELSCPISLGNVGKFIVAPDNTLAVSGQISGTTGGIVVDSSQPTGGVVRLTGSNTYGGGTTVNKGALEVGNGWNRVLTGDVTINSDGTVRVIGTGGNPFGVPGVAGSITINGGTLDMNTHPAHISTLSMTGGTVNTSWNGWNTLYIDGGSLTTHATNSMALIGAPIAMSNNMLRVIVDKGTVPVDLRIAGDVMQEGGDYTFDKQGPGTLEITGVMSHGNATYVSGGTMLMNGWLTDPGHFTAVQVVNGATLGGIGSIARYVEVDDGTIAPGHSIGEIGALYTGSTMFGVASLAAQIGAAGASDLLSITGSLGLWTSYDSLALLSDPGAFDGSTYTVARFTAGALGSDVFNAVTLDGAPINPAGFVANNILYHVVYNDLPGGGGSVQVAAVPEPSALVLLGIAALGLLACLGRRRRSGATH